MGSACFSRGSKKIVDAVNAYFDNNLPENVFLHGSLCTGNCEKGPVIIVDDEVYTELNDEKVFDVLSKFKFK
jgi:NADH:ubiquinone oxidoreductase subunit E